MVSIAAQTSSGSDMRPGPFSLQAIVPSLGPMKEMPRFFSISTLATVAACVHMRTFIAGAASTGLSVESNTVEARSSAKPDAMRARILAGGGGGHHRGGARLNVSGAITPSPDWQQH